MQKISVISSNVEYISQYRLLKKQIELFNRYMENDHDFFCVVGKTNKNEEEVEKILSETKKDNIKTIVTPISNYLGHASHSSADRMERAIRTLHEKKYYKCFCVHLDVFPVKKFNLMQMMCKCPLGGVIQYRPYALKSTLEVENTSKYLWENFLYVDTEIIDPSEIDLMPGILPKGAGDSGAGTSRLLSKYDTKILGSHERILENCCAYLSDENEIKKINLDEKTKKILNEITELKKTQFPFHAPELFIEEIFYHYRSITGWHLNNNSINIEITNKCIELLMEL